jgi:hypothetical protein
MQPPSAVDLDGCWNVYLDCGSNIGVQVRKLFEPRPYAAALVQPAFSSFFGNETERRRWSCAVGIEPNPQHGERLSAIQMRYNALGWRTTFLTRTAVGTTSGDSLFYFDTTKDGKAHEQWASGMIPFAMNQGPRSTFYRNHTGADAAGRSANEHVHVGKRAKVRVIDLAAWIQQYVLNRKLPLRPVLERYPSPTLAMKMDIEGGEVDLLPQLLRSRVLCAFSVVFIEYHARLLRGTHAEVALSWPEQFQENASQVCRATQFLSMDDETFLHDGMPLP